MTEPAFATTVFSSVVVVGGSEATMNVLRRASVGPPSAVPDGVTGSRPIYRYEVRPSGSTHELVEDGDVVARSADAADLAKPFVHRSTGRALDHLGRRGWIGLPGYLLTYESTTVAVIDQSGPPPIAGGLVVSPNGCVHQAALVGGTRPDIAVWVTPDVTPGDLPGGLFAARLAAAGPVIPLSAALDPGERLAALTRLGSGAGRCQVRTEAPLGTSIEALGSGRQSG